ncbi:MAG: glycosyltransferase [Alphaproteobacteria bacterium GM7ARS4]|nr:glycosyltransferase [Alphaproteobacteria bacterium GM7ARS4]
MKKTTNKAVPLSCCILVRHGREDVARALMSVKTVADDIVVVGEGGDGDIESVARAFGARFFHHPQGTIEQRRQWSQGQCQHDWVLHMHADEWLGESLRREIVSLFARGAPPKSFYCYPMVDMIYPIHEKPRLWARTHRHMRLYHRGQGQQSAPSHPIVPRREMGHLRGLAMCRPIRDFHHAVGWGNRLSSLYAARHTSSLWLLLLRLFGQPFFSFLRAYVWDRHCMGGLWGLSYSIMYAAYRFTCIIKLLERQRGWAQLPQRMIDMPARTEQGARKRTHKRTHRRKEGVPLSCFIIAYNEEDRIHWPLSKLCDWADDVLVVDGGSTDKTVDVARSYGVRVLSHPWHGYGEQKCFAQNACRYDWVLNLDADEWPSDALLEEIEAVMARPEKERAHAYAMPRLDCLSGEASPRKTARPWSIVRFYHRKMVGFNDVPFAEEVIVAQGRRIARCVHVCYHYPVRSFEHFWDKDNRTTSLIASRGKALPWLVLRLLTERHWSFFRMYGIKGGYRDGLRGYIRSNAFSFVYVLRIIKKLEYRLGWLKMNGRASP